MDAARERDILVLGRAAMASLDELCVDVVLARRAGCLKAVE